MVQATSREHESSTAGGPELHEQHELHELPLPRPPPSLDTPVLTMLGDQDGVVDLEAAEETA